MSKDLTIRHRLFRSIVVALTGAAAGYVLMLSLDLRRPYGADSFLLEAALIGGAIGAVLGFVLSDYD
jgi:hypothetical protein